MAGFGLQCRPGWQSGTLMQFNHPGWINFNDWFYHPEVSDWARLEEVGNGNGASYVFSEAEFIRSLDYGWKVGATNNADTHTDQWGTNTDNRTGVLMTELTKANLLEAMRLRRTFATEDMNFSLTMKANDEWMGSEIPNTGSIEFDITAQDRRRRTGRPGSDHLRSGSGGRIIRLPSQPTTAGKNY